MYKFSSILRNISSTRKTISRLILSVAVCFSFLSSPAIAEDKPTFRLAWSIYVGWMPWDYGNNAGIIKKWGDKYGVNIDVVQVNDYIESINQYTASSFDATVMTNMDALTIPAASGVDSTALIVGDFSNGNDGIVLKSADNLADIKGQRVNLVELSVSHYLLARALETVDMTERDVTVVNTTDADLVPAFVTEDVTAVTTWNPLLAEIIKMPNANKVFDSSMIPGEIIDLLVVNTDTLAQHPELGKALTGAWYEIMATMQQDNEAGAKALEFMAAASGTDLAGYKDQLASTKMFYKPADAVAFTESAALKATMAKVAEFSFKHGLLGEGAPDAGFIGIETPAGVFGDEQNITLRFNPDYMAMAADNAL
ncbi:putative urea ABC transporter substrate-binding protein [Enterovibrio sp. ZSDZ42]|uniref:Urea ABC transporter substrate-binding protein n=1 Tax=Enterovibrio gelatinilyticus TaxID=2899819 RepID=A0ABT5R8G7_9GAMM|nr:putative urea ABC transporter substrate-binding protein [Enterovibrio sp. ZSDZ42]MDD1796135.1 putative urea ABC transporter substrate-binding protein [Enterovibrio sp. ZSDZ42]